MQSKTWIYDWDKHSFEDYAENRTLEEMTTHTRNGELIIHRDEQGKLWYVEDESAVEWEEDSIVEVELRAWNRAIFTTATTIWSSIQHA